MNTEETTNNTGAAGTSAPPSSSWTAEILDPATPGTLVTDWHTKAPEPAKWEPYKAARNLDELLGMAEKRVGDAQTALRTRPAPSHLPPRPDKSAPPETWRTWREAHGLPERPEDYAIARPDDFPEQLWNDEEAADFMRFAHENDLKPDTVRAIVDWQQTRSRHAFSDHQRREAESFTKLQADESASLTKMFGVKLDPTLRNLQAIAQASGARPSWFDPHARDFAGVEMVHFFSRLLDRIPRGEDATRQSMGTAQKTPSYDLTWAKAAIRHGHPDHEALTNAKHPRHAELTELRNQAYAMAGSA